MSRISIEQVRHIAKFARLKFSADDELVLVSQLETILKYVEKISELELDNVEPLVHPIIEFNAFRSDKPFESIPRDEALKNAPETTDGFFSVPPVIEEPEK